RAPLLQIPVGLEAGEHPQQIEGGHRSREQGLPDVIAGDALALEQRDGHALSRQERGRCGACWSSAYDDDLEPTHPRRLTPTARPSWARASCSWSDRCRTGRTGPAPWPSRDRLG